MNRKKRLVFIVSLLCIFGLLVFGPARVAPAETINIGYTGPLSGGAAKYGRNNLEGQEMAVDEI
ncbi:MAG: ethanolamine utilization protein EutJ, partial [Deltaproteobacteria bacterium]|nr:ethanolamine utilization protein EutJ [Deltaproteobacteria bacterium]